MKVNGPKGNWRVREILNSEADFCRHRAYPANYVGCKHPKRISPDGPPECCKDDCPIQLRK